MVGICSCQAFILKPVQDHVLDILRHGRISLGGLFGSQSFRSARVGVERGFWPRGTRPADHGICEVEKLRLVAEGGNEGITDY